MGIFISDQPDVSNLILIYLLYLINSVLSYLLVYKRTLIDAHQLIYIGILNQTIFLVIQDIAQILVLIFTHNFILFLCIYLAATLGANLANSHRANKLYPYLKDKSVTPIAVEERRDIYKNIRAMLMHKIGTVVVNNTDNLLISAFIGVIAVGKYSNYYLLIGSIRQIIDQIFTGITASVGNLGVAADRARMKKIFESSFFIGHWLYGVAAICLYEIINPFVSLSFGANYLFDLNIVLILCVNFYVTGMRRATLVFQDSMGLFWYNRKKAIVEAIINLIASIALAIHFGVIGVFVGTLISTLATSTWVEPYVLYKHKLSAALRGYFIRYGLYTLVIALAWLATDSLCSLIDCGLVKTIILRALICATVPNMILLLAYFRCSEFRFILKKVMQLIKSKENAADDLSSQPSIEEEMLLKALKASLNSEDFTEDVSRIDFDKFFYLSGRHAVTPLLYDTLIDNANLPDFYRERLTIAARQTANQSYRLLLLTRTITELLGGKGIPVLVLKGAAASAYYPVFELRKSGDVDILLLNEADIKKATAILCEAGLSICDSQHGNHHVAFRTKEGIEIEVHTMLAEPFDNARINQYLKGKVADFKKNQEELEIIGVKLVAPQRPEFAFHLLVHMLQHFLRAGFGLKLLCDWVVFWNTHISDEQRDKYLNLVDEAGMRGFSDLVTTACVKYLGLDEGELKYTAISYDDETLLGFIREVFDAEEFGRSTTDRMVVLRDASLISYAREFHHQMRLNFPKASLVFITWPALWIATLVNFIRNNWRVRATSAAMIFKTAKLRSSLVKKMELFK